ncbi:MAG: hypothetical protein ACRCVJ_08225 [Clostridium sp.]|uniref:hypothetical protein n=1 Tax=Clostridium sp. TaxID=1506 RepID=UPI003F3DD585
MKKKLPNNRKIDLVFFAIGIILIICALVFVYKSMSTDYLLSVNSKSLKGFGKDLATFCEICFFLVIGLFIIRLILKNMGPKGMQLFNKGLTKAHIKLPEQSKEQYFNTVILTKIRKIILPIAKLFQKFHVPIAIVACSVIIIHGYIFFHLGFKWNAGYILGVLALSDLVLMIITGFFRIFNKGIHAHKGLGVLFIILMILHIAIV